MTNQKPVRVRFAPSPTGRVHLGSARTALYDYLVARQNEGQFILRIEDTDRKRYVEGAEEELINGLKWLGVQWDEGPDIGGPYGPYRQSERKEIYQEYAQKLIDSGHAYPCFCTSERISAVREEQQKNKINPHYDGLCRKVSLEEAKERVANGERHVVRFKTPKDGATTVTDLVRGDITIENKQLDDAIIVKSDGWALYHLAAMVDDHLMKISHVIRGSEWLPTFPLHSMLYRAFGWEEPIWIHLSVFLKPSGKGKMSKREAQELNKTGHSIFVQDMEELGYLPEGIINWISLMGWSLDDHTEFFSLDNLIRDFDLNRLNPSPAAINFSKLDHFNGLHIRNLSIDDLADRLLPVFIKAGCQADLDKVKKITPIIQERLVTLDDCIEKAGFLFKDEVSYAPEFLIAKGLDPATSLEILNNCIEILKPLPEISAATAEQPMRDYVERSGYKAGQVFGILRNASTGQTVTPPLFETLEIIGRDKVMERLINARGILTKYTKIEGPGFIK
ncbi:MAG: glutamate--tRNA ligase [Anaerolineaceae bacterium]|nr:glutamate--tRNA ligase [Anaerolineaceae bacterium]